MNEGKQEELLKLHRWNLWGKSIKTLEKVIKKFGKTEEN